MVALKDLCYRHPANTSAQSPRLAPHALTNMDSKFVAHGLPVVGNQGAIRMGVCLKSAGASRGRIGQPTCQGHAAQDMHLVPAAAWAGGLAGASIPGVGNVARNIG